MTASFMVSKMLNETFSAIFKHSEEVIASENRNCINLFSSYLSFEGELRTFVCFMRSVENLDLFWVPISLSLGLEN